MPIVIGFMFTGIVVGYLLRDISFLKNTEKTITCTVLLLLFIIGISIGSNKSVINNLPHFGWQAGILAVLSTCGSIFASWMVLKLFSQKGGKS